jgi:valyl-tRNA synthetase
MTEGTTSGGRHDLPKAYAPAAVERAIYERWLAADVFAPDGSGSRADPAKRPFVIVQPPPNVTGALHIGHAFTADIEDVMVRHARMQGRPTLWLPGLDHASIAAQVVLDKILATEGETRQSLGRERYLERMWAFVESTRDTILRQSRRFGSSLDWDRARFTMDEVSSKAVRTAFARLYRDGLAYRTEALVNWCPGCRTSVSDLEVAPTPETGTLWTIRYHLLDGAGRADPERWIAVATTRPETILGDVAVAVHPEDPRYRDLVGRTVLIPFVGRPVPVIEDAVVQRDFGTGAVKITPAHDADDNATGQRHGLPAINILDDDARLNVAAGPYAGLDRYEARKRILIDLEAMGDLEATKAHEMIIGRCQRSNDAIEPRLKTQWFIRTKPLAEQALAATRSGRVRILPERFDKVWEHWLTEIRDWNVSRQLWWGHRIPAWYCPDGHVTVSAEADGPAACAACDRPAAELEQDPDIFDTWFSSGLWPFSTLGWPDDTADLRRFYPGTVMETGYDIIFFWVARMMMLGIHFLGEPPFETVYLHGMVRDGGGQKMSKTKGNVVDPLEAIDEIGADALRFAMINGTSPGNDQKFSQEKLENARNFGNKLWNAARFVLGARPATIPADARRQAPDPARLGPADRWLRSRIAATVVSVDGAMGAYALGEASRLLYEATWNEFCDWGLEFAKVRLVDETLPAADREATWWALVEALDALLRLLHPFLPFLTEAIWSAVPHAAGDPELLIVADWPDGTAWVALRDLPTEAAVDPLRDLVTEIRNARATARIAPGEWRSANIRVPAGLLATFDALVPALERLARLRPIVRHEARGAFLATERPGELAVIAGELEALVGVGSAVEDGADSGAAERDRLERELATAEAFLAATRARLANEAFATKAPPAVVEAARVRASELAEQVDRLRARLGR